MKIPTSQIMFTLWAIVGFVFAMVMTRVNFETAIMSMFAYMFSAVMIYNAIKLQQEEKRKEVNK